jgi:eukaryotic-like serine/threonine-protein kinase
MGMIYLAHDPLIDRKVAIKLVRADLLVGEDRADYLARFKREAQMAGRCAHANIVQVYDLSVHEGNPYLAMEYVEGSNLVQVLQRSGRFPPAMAAAVIGQVLSALACAHGLGIVHRDVKPANVLLLPDLRVKMTDFGIARLDTSGLTLAGSILGTPSYMSPEQCYAGVVDARSDLFSTGVVLYELLSGARPFTGQSPTAIAFQIVNAPAPDLRTMRADLPHALVQVVERALAKQPEDRFASAEEMAAALKRSTHVLPDTILESTTVQAVQPRTQVVFTEAGLGTLERRLAQYIGPIARVLVQNAARRAKSIDELHEIVAQSIDQPEQRARFRAELTGAAPVTGATGTGAERSARSVTPALAQQAERELILHVGPIARVLVKRALESATSADDLWQRLSAHIEREADRKAFLSKRRM